MGVPATGGIRPGFRKPAPPARHGDVPELMENCTPMKLFLSRPSGRAPKFTAADRSLLATTHRSAGDGAGTAPPPIILPGGRA